RAPLRAGRALHQRHLPGADRGDRRPRCDRRGVRSGPARGEGLMGQILHVARREFMETARSRWFIIGTVAFPLMLGALMFLPTLRVRSGSGSQRCVVVDETGVLLAPLRETAKSYPMLATIQFLAPDPGAGGVEELRRAGGSEKYDALLYLPAG